MNTASILIKTDPQIKVRAQKTAQMLGLSLTSIINHYLKHFINTKTIAFNTDEERPSQYLIDALKKSEADVKAGRVITFKNAKEEFDYLDKEIADEKRRISSY